MLIQTCSIHCDVCVPFGSSSTTSGLLYCGWAEKSMTSSGDDRAIGVRWPDGDRMDICRSPSDYFPFIHTARSPSDLRAMIARWPGGDRRRIFGNIFPRKIGRWPSGAGHRPIFLGKILPEIGRSPPGHRGIIPRWSHGDRTVTQGWSAGSLDKESHLTVTARWPHGHLQASAGRPLDTLILSAVISIWRDCWDVMKTTMGYKN